MRNTKKISSYEASAYKSEINRFIEDFTMPEEKERGLMNWYDKGNSVDQKVFSAFMSVEEHDGELVGVVTANVHGQLTEDELEDFREYCTGQLSDGAGESLEQRPIKNSRRRNLCQLLEFRRMVFADGGRNEQ